MGKNWISFFFDLGNFFILIIKKYKLKGVIRPFKNQDYEELKSQHSESNLFVDPHFAADSSSLYFSQMPPQGIQKIKLIFLFYKYNLNV